jgi:Sigma-70 region 2
MDESMRKGNQGEAFEHSRVLLFSFASRMTGSASEAEDLVQETRCMRRTGNAQPSQEAPPKQGNTTLAAFQTVTKPFQYLTTDILYYIFVTG